MNDLEASEVLRILSTIDEPAGPEDGYAIRARHKRKRYDFSYVSYFNEAEFTEWLWQRLVRAYRKARLGKRATVDEHKFELNAMENLRKLHQAILAGQYQPGRGIAFITYRPVTREIFAAPFKDRVVHHFLFDMVYDWWDARLIYDAYSCRKEKGVLMGVKRAQHFIRSVSENYTKPAYIIKLDVQGYFMSLPRAGLMERVRWGLNQQFAEKGLLYDILIELWKAVIFDDPCDGVERKGPLSNWDDLPSNKSLFCQPPGQGIVIGNLSSQLLSNIYLDQLDRFMMYDLGYTKYGRYVDDFFFVVPAEQLGQAKRDIRRIREFLAQYGLVLHPKKVYIQEVRHGVKWLGTVITPAGVMPDRRIKGYFYESAARMAVGRGEIESIISYLGHMTHMRARKFESEIFERFGWEYRF